MDTNTVLSEIIGIISEEFEPAKTIRQATHLFTTDEIKSGVEGIIKVKTNILIEALKEAGFIYKNIGELQFRWLLKIKLQSAS